MQVFVVFEVVCDEFNYYVTDRLIGVFYHENDALEAVKGNPLFRGIYRETVK